jgi:hypothetical protein
MLIAPQCLQTPYSYELILRFNRRTIEPAERTIEPAEWPAPPSRELLDRYALMMHTGAYDYMRLKHENNSEYRG